MLLDKCSEAHKLLTSNDDHIAIIEDEKTPRPRKKESYISNSEDEVRQDEIYQTPPTLKRPKVPMLSISRGQDSSLSEMSTSEEDGTDKEEENRIMVVKGKGACKVIIKHMQASPQLNILIVLL
jgi:hypothetical protein